MRMLDHKTHKIFWRLFVNQRLSWLLADQFETLTNSNVSGFVDLLGSMGISGMNAAFVACGLKDIMPHQRIALENLFDADHRTREKLICELSNLKQKKRQIETASLPEASIEAYRRQQFKLEEAHEAIIRTQMQLDSLGKRNSVPHDLYKYPTVSELEERGYVFQVEGNPCHFLSEQGETIVENAEKLAAMLKTDLHKEPSRETIESIWNALRSQLDSSNPRSVMEKATSV